MMVMVMEMEIEMVVEVEVMGCRWVRKNEMRKKDL